MKLDNKDIMLALSLILKCHDFAKALNASTNVTYIPVLSKRTSPIGGSPAAARADDEDADGA